MLMGNCCTMKFMNAGGVVENVYRIID